MGGHLSPRSMVTATRLLRVRMLNGALSLAACTLTLVPAGAWALNVDQVLRVGEQQVVSRGDFVRAAVKLLNLTATETDASLPYVRVPSAMEPYVRAAHEKYALRAFGKDLQLARSITRGQAAQVLAALHSLEGDGDTSYEDVDANTDEAKAIAAVVARGWMEPQRANYFGTRRVLKGDEAQSMLRRALGQSDTEPAELPERLERQKAQAQTITINLTGGTTSLPKQAILETVWQLIQSDFLFEDNIDADEAAYRAAEAIVQSLKDPYTSFLRPAGVSSLNTQIDGEVSGIGAQVEQRDGILTVVTPLRGSPAEKAGLLPNDEILKADDTVLTGLDFLQAVEHIRGAQGTRVRLHIRRSGAEFDVTVVRDMVKVPEVEITWQGEIAVVTLLQFGRTTDTLLRGEMEKIEAQNPRGIILDLRNNPGGLLHAANIVVSNFVRKGSGVAQIISREGERDDSTEFTPTISMDIPLVVLVNEGSASASEIVAGALQDHERATIVGTKTFGKGTVQQVVQFNDNSGMKMTVAEWRTPKGRQIDGAGVTPDVVVEYDADRDVQLLKALELLR